MSSEVGDEWLNWIKSAIGCARYFALIYSENANESTYVKQEVECATAISRRGWILLDKSQPRQEIRKLLGRINASIAYNGDRDSAIARFAQSIAEALWKPYSGVAQPSFFIRHVRIVHIAPMKSPIRSLAANRRSKK